MVHRAEKSICKEIGIELQIRDDAPQKYQQSEPVAAIAATLRIRSRGKIARPKAVIALCKLMLRRGPSDLPFDAIAISKAG